MRPPELKKRELMALLMKLIYTGGCKPRQFMDAIKLPYRGGSELVQMAVDRQLLHTLGTRDSDT